ncbi:hypothetical protein JXQ31_03360 [candidate division KSB1 bacterium]|nr:hypothetical protein [candidate division KSB1 bacterium]
MIKELLQRDEIKVSLVGGICIILVAVFVKMIFHLEQVPFHQNGTLLALIFYLMTRGAFIKRKETPKWDNPLVWSLVLVFVSIVTVLLHVY